MKITIGRTVLYVLNEEDAKQINRRRTDSGSIAERIKGEKWPLGAQAHIGNNVEAGGIYPAVAVRIFDSSGNNPTPPTNLHVLLDGNDTYWATSRSEDAAKVQGSWHWPERV